MHINRIDLNLLVVFEAIYTEGGITRASEKLHLTQPAVSHALGRLRGLFDDPLFTREGRKMAPTPLARNVIIPVRQSLRGLQTMFNDMDRFDPATTEKHFTLALPDIMEARILPPLLQRITAVAPKVEVTSVRVARRELETQLATGAVDVAIDVLLPLSEHVRRARRELGRLVTVARRDHPAVDDDLDLDTYLALEHILVSSRRAGPGLEDVELSRRGLQRRIRLRCQHYFAACRVAQASDLIVTMPERYARIVNASLANRIAPLPFKVSGLDGYVYWHASVENDPANQWLREQVTEALAADQRDFLSGHQATTS